MRLLARVMASRTRSSAALPAASAMRFADGLHGGLGRQFAGRLAAHAIHHQEHAALGIHPVAVLVAVAQQAGIGGRAGERGHRPLSPQCASTKTTTNARKATTNGVCR